MKSIACAMIAFLEDIKDINFVAEGWDNTFLRLCVSERRSKGPVKSDPVKAWNMDQVCILLHLTHLQEQKHCDEWYKFWLRMSLIGNRVQIDNDRPNYTKKNLNICIICNNTYSVTFIFISIACIFSLVGYSMVGFLMFWA